MECDIIAILLMITGIDSRAIHPPLLVRLLVYNTVASNYLFAQTRCRTNPGIYNAEQVYYNVCANISLLKLIL